MVLAFIFILIIIAIAAGILVQWFWVEMLVDIAKRKFPHSKDKTRWFWIVGLTNGIGAAVYYYKVKKKNVSNVSS